MFGDGFGLAKTEDFLPLYAASKKLRSDNQINSRIRTTCCRLKCCTGARFSRTRENSTRNLNVSI